jgi:hypothetical protein
MTTSGDNVQRSPESGGVDRRRFLTLGGVSILASAVLAACSTKRGSSSNAASSETTTSTTAPAAQDIDILRTAQSLEVAAAAGYQKIIDANVVTTSSLSDAVKAFQTHHQQHAQLFENAILGAGGKAYPQPNPVVMNQLLTPRLAAVKTEADATKLLFDLEHMLSATFQSNVGSFSNIAFNSKVASVGGSEAAHIAFLGPPTGRPTTPDGAFGSTDGAVPTTTIS